MAGVLTRESWIGVAGYGVSFAESHDSTNSSLRRTTDRS
ncbi:hypothetical protein JOF29_008541 [Kribbella aluminosa]|uniref:Uncharacterized protein n=1 Tax=Kribbella aluminosa TaxID=416017 RepID=A0ABS4V0W2_9ACTN|nr:hypothetical protein [Kribbella aluminosa]